MAISQRLEDLKEPISENVNHIVLETCKQKCHSSQNKNIKHAFELSMASVGAAVSESICERATEQRRVFGRLACTIQNGNRWRKI